MMIFITEKCVQYFIEAEVIREYWIADNSAD